MELHTALSPDKLSFRHVGWGWGSSEPNEPPWTTTYIIRFLPRDAMRKRDLCCRLLSFRPSVRHVGGLYPHDCRYRELLFGPVAPLLTFLVACAGTRF